MNQDHLLQHASFIRSLTGALSRDPEAARDLEQETWVAAIEKPPRSSGALRSWFRTVAGRRIRGDRIAEERRRRREKLSARDERLGSTYELVARREMVRFVTDALFSLDDRSQEVVLLRYYEGLPPRRIAERLGIPVATVKTRLKRALQTLRARLDDRCGERGAWLPVCASISGGLGILEPGGEAVGSTGAGLSVAAWGGLFGFLGLLVLGVAIALGFGRGDPVVEIPKVSSSDEEGGSTALGARTADDPQARSVSSDTNRGSTGRGTGRDEEGTSGGGGAMVSGRVVDRAGRPISGARVVGYSTIHAEAIRAGGDPVPGVFTTESDFDGGFRLDFQTTPAAFELCALAPGHGPGIATTVEPFDRVTLILTELPEVRGRVLDLEGFPVVGATIRWQSLFGSLLESREAISGADGSYHLIGMPQQNPFDASSSSWVSVEARGRASHLCRVRPERISESEYSQDFYVPQGIALSGRAIDAITGAPLSGVSLELRPLGRVIEAERYNWPFTVRLGPRSFGEARSDPKGRFTFDWVPVRGVHETGVRGADPTLPGGVAEIVASKDGYAESRVEVPQDPDSESVEVTVRCWRGATVVGRVISGRGKPVPGARVSFEGWENPELHRSSGSMKESEFPGAGDSPGLSWSGSTETDELGRFQLLGVPSISGARAEVRLRVESRRANLPAFAPTVRRIRVRPGETTSVEVKLEDPPLADVRVLDEKGRPVWGAEVVVSFGQSYRTDRRGEVRVSFPELGGGAKETVQVVVKAKGFGIVRSIPFLPRREDPPELDVVLLPELFIEGVVRSADGGPVAGALVRVVGIDTPIDLPLFTDRGGAFRAVGLSMGQYRVYAAPPGSQELQREGKESRPGGKGVASPASVIEEAVAAGTKGLMLVLAAPDAPRDRGRGQVRVDVVDRETRSPVTRLRRVALTRPGESLEAVQVTPGRYRFSSVGLGDWTLSVLGFADSRWVDHSSPVEFLSPSEDHLLEIELEAGAVLRGRVESLVFRSFFGARIELGERRGVVGRDRRFSVEGLRPGSIVPARLLEGGKFWWIVDGVTSEVTIPNGDPLSLVNLDLNLVPAGSFSVEFEGGSERETKTSFGNRERLDEIEVRDSDGHTVRRFSERLPSSRNRCESLLPVGNYWVRLLRRHTEPEERRLEIRHGERASVKFSSP